MEFIYQVFAQIEVSLSRAQLLQVDGEVIGETDQVKVKVCPEKLPVLVPQNYGES